MKLDDNLNVAINIKWLIQIIVGTAIIVYGYLTIEQRILNLEISMFHPGINDDKLFSSIIVI